jgi:hypothetical protein
MISPVAFDFKGLTRHATKDEPSLQCAAEEKSAAMAALRR